MKRGISRRSLIVLIAAGATAGAAWPLARWLRPAPQGPEAATTADETDPHAIPSAGPRPARYWQSLADNRVQCELCPHLCQIPAGGRGFCRVRENRAGTLYSLVYGKPVALGRSPIEKAPFNHFYPGHIRHTVATVGCNLRCAHCQNWHISQRTVEEMRYRLLSPQEIIARVQEAGLRSVSFTYTEPTVFYEYQYDIAELAKQQGIKTSLVTNGFINPEPLRALLKHMDAVRVDLKAFTERFYRETSGAKLAPVLNTLQTIQQEGVWLEIINLVIPTLNDSPDEIRAMCAWIMEHLGPDVPLHFNRFHPAYRMTHLPPTPIETLEQAHAIATDVGINFVNLGNVPAHRYNNTFCPGCKEMLIHRVGMAVLENRVVEGRCEFCGRGIPGVWG